MEVTMNDCSIRFWPAALAGMAVIVYIRWRRHRSVVRTVCDLFVGIYLLFALDKVLFPIDLWTDFAKYMRQEGLANAINLIPFNGLNEINLPYKVQGYLLNLLLTLPLGFSIVFISRIRKRDFLLLPIAVGIGIELTQLLLDLILGYTARVVDIDDAIFNALGILVGYGVFRLLAHVYSQVDYVLPRYLEFIHEVFSEFNNK